MSISTRFEVLSGQTPGSYPPPGQDLRSRLEAGVAGKRQASTPVRVVAAEAPTTPAAAPNLITTPTEEQTPTEKAPSPNAAMLQDFVIWARGQGVVPHHLVHATAEGKPQPLNEVWIVRPPLAEGRYWVSRQGRPEPRQSGWACSADGRLFEFDDGTGQSVTLRRNCPGQGWDSADVDPSWLANVLDVAENNIMTTQGAGESTPAYGQWAATRQHTGHLALHAA